MNTINMQRIHGTFWKSRDSPYKNIVGVIVTMLGWADLAVHRLTSISRIALLILTQLATRVSTLRSLGEERLWVNVESLLTRRSLHRYWGMTDSEVKSGAT